MSDHNRPSSLLQAFRHRLEYGAFSALAFMAQNGNPKLVDGLSAWIWRIAAPHFHRHPRAQDNLSLAMPELDPAMQESILLKMWDNLGRTMMESFALSSIADDPESLVFNFTDEAAALIKSDRPVIFVGLHAGNWEVSAVAAERFGKSLMGVYQKILNPLIDHAVTTLRQRFYKGGLFTKGSETVTRIRRGLSEGHSLALMADLRDAHGEPVPFFGVDARSTVFPALLARMHKLPIIAVRVIRIGLRRFRVDAVVIELHKNEDRAVEIKENTYRIQQQFEAWIRDEPGTWMWGHKRWRRKLKKNKRPKNPEGAL